MERGPEVHETALPGIGVRHEFTTAEGRRVGLVSHRSGRRDVLLYDERDPDAAGTTVVLSPPEAEALASLLGAARITRALDDLPEQVEGLVVEWLALEGSSRYAGRPLGDTRARTRTGVSVVAVGRGGAVHPAPGPEFVLGAGDHLVTVGTPPGVAALRALLDE
ncbi:MAG TPA: cation:proton antiporter regulatory subunit [Mycobacteriales bacterium]|nr:cation:proton antiporter regulatory subunit [Mycobacteriales bacterium]